MNALEDVEGLGSTSTSNLRVRNVSAVESGSGSGSYSSVCVGVFEHVVTCDEHNNNTFPKGQLQKKNVTFSTTRSTEVRVCCLIEKELKWHLKKNRIALAFFRHVYGLFIGYVSPNYAPHGNCIRNTRRTTRM